MLDDTLGEKSLKILIKKIRGQRLGSWDSGFVSDVAHRRIILLGLMIRVILLIKDSCNPLDSLSEALFGKLLNSRS